MRKVIFSLSGLVTIILIWSCAAKQLPPPESEYEKDAIKIHVKADPQLNLSDGKPHTLLVCVYQLNDPNAFNQLAGDQEGLYRLLECDLFDASVDGAKKLIVQPGQNTTFNLDRSQGARYVAVAAGYYLIERERVVRLYEIPVIIEKKGFIRRSKRKKLDTLEIDLKLGSQQIQ
ncbi:MAG: type VI secretion system lipoprotein TssJ [Desulfobacterales bacterium]|nr:MAG: type VI secretion system lipoprotein TssJ [Desulfobacterales bacterium]